MKVLVRLGELTLKSDRSRRRFLRALISNISDALRSEGYGDFSIKNMWSRLLVEIDNESPPSVLRRVFGIISYSPVTHTRALSFEDIVEKGYELFKDKVIGKKFAVRVKRTGNHSFRSIDIARSLGDKLYSLSAGVDLKNPEVEVFVEIRDKDVFFFDEVINAYGGLPIGTEGVAISLLSGGFDSAVASWMTLRRGARVHYLFLNLGGEEYLNSMLPVATVLARFWSYGYEPIMYVVPGREIVMEIMKCREDYWNIILKRIMYRLAEWMALEFGADTIITGESLGQVASQTMRNLLVSQEAVRIPVNRPLFGLDKQDIIDMAREIGTYEYSSKVKEYCALVPRKPVLKASLDVVKREEEKINMDVVTEAYENKKVINLRELDIDLSAVGMSREGVCK